MNFFYSFYIFLIFISKILGLRQALLKCNFDSNDNCISYSIENLNPDIEQLRNNNIEVKSLLHKRSYIPIIKNNHKIKLQGFPLISLMTNEFMKRIVNPGFILGKNKKNLKSIFHRSVKRIDDQEMYVLIVLHTFIYIPIKSRLKYNIIFSNDTINSKDYSIEYCLWKIKDFIKIEVRL